MGGGSHGYIGLVLTNTQYALILNTTFVYPTHPCPLILLDGTTSHINSNMRIMHTEAVRLLREVMGVYKYLIQKIITIVEETNLMDIRNRTTNLINDTVTNALTDLKDNHGQIMPHKLFKR